MSNISIIYGTNVMEMTCTLLRQSDVAKRLTAGMNVVVKPNLVVAKPAAEGAVTHPEICEFQAEMRPKPPVMNQSHLVHQFARHIDERNACSACYAALICALHQHSELYGWLPDSAINGTIKIGQSFRDRKCTGFGIGNCCSGCKWYVPGCPPTAAQILEMLR